ncbi:MAG: ATP-binding cassette domain-containing protein [Candidatus Latescibacteria bacterium]|nr:ATP-binding cassette domain-containing protein [Candidatus Latescibacterota bacterium]
MNLPIGKYTQLLTRYLQRQPLRVAGLGALVLAGLGLQLLNPQILRRFLDAASATGPLATVVELALLYLAVQLLEKGLGVGANYLGGDVGWRATNMLREDLLQHSLQLDMAFHNRTSPGELIERIDGDVEVLNRFFSQFVFIIVGNLLLMAGALFFLSREHIAFGTVFAVYGLLAVAAYYRFRDVVAPLYADSRAQSAAWAGFLEERLAGIDDLRSSGAVAYTRRRFGDKVRAHLNAAIRARMASEKWMLILGLSPLAGQAGALCACFWFYQRGEMTIGTVFLIVQYARMVLQPIGRLIGQVGTLQAVGGSIERLDRLVREQSRLVVAGPGLQPDRRQGELDFQDVSFGYGTGPQVLRHITFRLVPGRSLGLLGRTGSGKTTLTRLVFRLYDPLQGTIRLNGVDLKSWDSGALRRAVGLVTQDVQLFGASLRDNLTFFDRAIDDNKILTSLEEVGLGPWLASLPAGLETPIASGGANLSAGQGQLLALGRVYLRNPQLVILDEASSRLDPLTERFLNEAIERLLKGRTAIVIAHRLETVEKVDELMILEEGRIVEAGGRQELAERSGSRYAALRRTGAEAWLD